ncbi:hypothetical protein [Neolewinella agarilytica]|uniref:Uncharacterized protein n=1 Tax=Neolewinella agarilytica TaxID=478744 RepID=A0A1H9AL48_9BACT|nr:hypothetical protein [Neolewinella agarilytica]SEP76668.1 hypothetical protein SAMN05444359_102118 [Neolewinella agarilytica]
MNDYLHLYAHVEFVKGSQLGALYDLQGGRVRTVPLILESILKAFQMAPTQQVLKETFAGNETVFHRYTDFLLKEKWAFTTTKPQVFPAADLSWESPYAINSGIVSHDRLQPYDLPSALLELSDVGCRTLELQLHNYSLKEEDSAVWDQIGAALRQGEFRRGTLVLGVGQTAMPVVNPAEVDRLLHDWPRFGTVVLLGQEKDINLKIGKRQYYLRCANTLMDYAKKTWELRPNVHFVGPAYFRESRVANPYFNRRLAIDSQGYFKNDLLYGGQETFGKIGQRTIKEVIIDPQFQQRWRANPDVISDTSSNPLRYCLRYDRAIEADAKDPTNWSFSWA